MACSTANLPGSQLVSIQHSFPEILRAGVTRITRIPQKSKVSIRAALLARNGLAHFRIAIGLVMPSDHDFRQITGS